MDSFDWASLIEIDATHPPIEHTGHALHLKSAAIAAIRERDADYKKIPDEKVWEILRKKTVSFDMLVVYIGAISDLLDKHEQRLDGLDPPKAGGA
jgi:hypothetical protein